MPRMCGICMNAFNRCMIWKDFELPARRCCYFSLPHPLPLSRSRSLVADVVRCACGQYNVTNLPAKWQYYEANTGIQWNRRINANILARLSSAERLTGNQKVHNAEQWRRHRASWLPENCLTKRKICFRVHKCSKTTDVRRRRRPGRQLKRRRCKCEGGCSGKR